MLHSLMLLLLRASLHFGVVGCMNLFGDQKWLIFAGLGGSR
jgi:hypothetical protein